MMGEKRFTTKGVLISHYGVWDTDDKPYSNDEVVKLLNELNDENHELKRLIKKMGELGGFNKHLIKTIYEDLE